MGKLFRENKFKIVKQVKQFTGISILQFEIDRINRLSINMFDSTCVLVCRANPIVNKISYSKFLKYNSG